MWLPPFPLPFTPSPLFPNPSTTNDEWPRHRRNRSSRSVARFRRVPSLLPIFPVFQPLPSPLLSLPPILRGLRRRPWHSSASPTQTNLRRSTIQPHATSKEAEDGEDEEERRTAWDISWKLADWTNCSFIYVKSPRRHTAWHRDMRTQSWTLLLMGSGTPCLARSRARWSPIKTLGTASLYYTLVPTYFASYWKRYALRAVVDSD